jgi:gamma-glutamylcyclotransferase (GGCT)/AIG2-like uncharacterized protein YtfP
VNLFAYGSLMIPSVMVAVTGHNFRAEGACLRDYARFKVKGESYPGIIYQKGAFTNGVVYLGLDALSLKRLDEFEGDLYERVSVQVLSAQGGTLTAEAYVIKREGSGLLSSEPWDLEEFEKNHLEKFMASYKGFSLLRRTLAWDKGDIKKTGR